MSDAAHSRDWGLVAIMSVFGTFAAILLIGFIRALFTDYEGEQRAEVCESDYRYILQSESYGHAARNSHLWPDFRRDCPDQVQALNEYLDARHSVRLAKNDCTQAEGRVSEEHLEMLESYGECDGVPLADGYEVTSLPETVPPVERDAAVPVLPTRSAWPGGDAVSWNEAGSFVGTIQRVCGPLVSERIDEHGTYLNIGHDYPSANRFTVILWDYVYYEPTPPGTTVCAVGGIINYYGIAQIHANPEAVEFWS